MIESKNRHRFKGEAKGTLERRSRRGKVSVAFDQELLAKINDEARRTDRSFSHTVNTLCEAALKEKKS